MSDETIPPAPISLGPCPPVTQTHMYAIRFSVPIRKSVLHVKSSDMVIPRAFRMRGPGIFKGIWIGDFQQTASVEIGIEFRVFEDRDGYPRTPRTIFYSPDDALDDSSDGFDVAFDGFGGDIHLKLEIPEAVPDEMLHFMMTVAAGDPWPEALFKYDHESEWQKARVIDYFKRKTKDELEESSVRDKIRNDVITDIVYSLRRGPIRDRIKKNSHPNASLTDICTDIAAEIEKFKR